MKKTGIRSDSGPIFWQIYTFYLLFFILNYVFFFFSFLFILNLAFSFFVFLFCENSMVHTICCHVGVGECSKENGVCPESVDYS